MGRGSNKDTVYTCGFRDPQQSLWLGARLIPGALALEGNKGLASWTASLSLRLESLVW